MVHMPMGQQDLLHRGIELFDGCQDLHDVTAGIDNGSAPAGFAFEHAAVLLVGRDRDNGDFD